MHGRFILHDVYSVSAAETAKLCLPIDGLHTRTKMPRNASLSVAADAATTQPTRAVGLQLYDAERCVQMENH